MRAALFHRDHVEIDMCGAHSAIFQLFASRRDIVLPHLEEFRDYLRSCLCVSPAGRAAMHLVKLLPTILLNSCVEHATQVLEHHGFNPGPELVALMRRVASAKLGFVSACEDANLQRVRSRLNEGNQTYFLLEGIEAAFMRAFVGALLLRARPGLLPWRPRCNNSCTLCLTAASVLTGDACALQYLVRALSQLAIFCGPFSLE